uniref:AlNc14C430G11581 protein n=1 Tax=Albugo laibachii Nc14 TaxID=890382 RepID=F0WZJ0_9STRA|nr:AlNc14C430G11581 [Albugo laibachii Nc14]|eukprot:CCA26914.1 AlNc14C430G11581 [Albugo laibachii Nc14]
MTSTATLHVICAHLTERSSHPCEFLLPFLNFGYRDDRCDLFPQSWKRRISLICSTYSKTIHHVLNHTSKVVPPETKTKCLARGHHTALSFQWPIRLVQTSFSNTLVEGNYPAERIHFVLISSYKGCGSSKSARLSSAFERQTRYHERIGDCPKCLLPDEQFVQCRSLSFTDFLIATEKVAICHTTTRVNRAPKFTGNIDTFSDYINSDCAK